MATPCIGITDLPKTEITFGGVTRFWYTHAPTSLVSTRPAPLVIDMHGSGSCAEYNPFYSGWRELADAHAYVVVYAQASAANSQRWNSRLSTGVDDVAFLLSLIHI